MEIADKLTQIANNVPLVYDAGYEAGKAEGGDSWYDTFWDGYQNLGVSGVKGSVGTRRDYRYAFSNQGWGDTNYDPKYLIKTGANCEGMYQLTSISKKKVELNVSNCTSARTMFYYANVEYIGTLDLSKCTNTQYLCSYATNLVSIDKIISSATSVWSANSFEKCPSFTHCIFEGIIATNLSFKDSPDLDDETISSIINCLMTITDGVARTITFHQTVRNKLTPTQENLITKSQAEGGKGWTLVPATKT